MAPKPRLVRPRPVIVRPVRAPRDADAIEPASRDELRPVALAAMILAVLSFLVCASRGLILLYGDAVAHLGIARRILDARYPGLGQLGGVWLPLPHLLMLPFVQSMQAWQSGTAGAWPSLACYLLSVIGIYRLARLVLPERWSFAATVFFALNPNLLYLASTAMTEPLFLALFIWSTGLTLEGARSLAAGESKIARRRMLGAAVLTFLMVFTRYDGWVVGSAAWCIFAVAWWRSAKRAHAATQSAFVWLTVISVAGPLLWFWYNHHFAGDWLDFMRGPYSAAAIEKRTSPPGSKHYRGWHNPAWALLFYTRTAQVDAAFWETGFALTAASLAGAFVMWKRNISRVLLLLWVPLPFYVYSIAWGSVPIFIPQLYPHSFYNARYGMAMLPAFAIFAMLFADVVERKIRTRWPKLGDAFQPLVLLLIAANMVGMIYATPLVLKEAQVNSTTRIPFESALAREIGRWPQGSIILMDQSAHVGALQQAGVPLRTTLGPGDQVAYRSVLEAPSEYAQYVIAFDGDAVANAVKAHREGLSELLVMCHTGQPCARLYQSQNYKGAAAH